MLYLVAILLPPLAVLLAGKPGQAILNLFLTLALYIPGALHAVFVVHNHYADKRTDRVVAALGGSPPPDVPRWMWDHPTPKGPVTHLGTWHVRESGYGGFSSGADLSLAVDPSRLQIWAGDPPYWTGQDFALASLAVSVDEPGVRITREKGKLLGAFDPADGTDTTALLVALGGVRPNDGIDADGAPAE